MEWPTLLCAQRFRKPDAIREPGRSPFQQDLDRIVFSTAFRRLAHKTQVHPLAENDHVHTRLTHSIEVSSVGRSLGSLVGNHVLERIQPASIDGISQDSFGYIVQAACLAHDIGNPPFGHSGEDSISAWFREYFKNKEDFHCIGEKQEDFERFEGNAQGFRILTRLENHKNEGGLRLTYAVLGAFLKYPRLSRSDEDKVAYVGHKKFGAFFSEGDYLSNVADKCGLIRKGQFWCRHPLAFLVEAADDICYAIMDVEDGFELGYLPYQEARSVLEAIAGTVVTKGLGEGEQLAKLRATAINNLITSVAKVFAENEDAILSGCFSRPLVELTPYNDCVEEAKKLVATRIFQSPRKTTLELAGYEIISGLLNNFVPVIVEAENRGWEISRLSGHLQKMYRLLCVNDLKKCGDLYGGLLSVTDFVSGMTDRFALSMYRNLKGISF